MFLRLLAVQLDIESRRHIAIKTLVREDEADSGMSIGVLTHHFPTRARFKLNVKAKKPECSAGWQACFSANK